MAMEGGCHCGAIRYAIEGEEPIHNALCHCEDCRRAAGAPMVGWALFPKEAVKIRGTPVDYNSSGDALRQFCGTCGTGLFFLSERMFPGQIDVQSATLDDPDALKPEALIQLADAPNWIDGLASLPRFERYPGM